jgi:integral membrane protein
MRYIALAEATSFIALLIASFVKRTGGSELGVQILGPIHGVLFIAYVAIALNLRPKVGWSGKTPFWVLVGAVIPFGGYVVDWWLLRDRPHTAT